MKKFLLNMLICLPLALFAQTEGKYLEGAVPVVDGKVTFTTEMSVNGMNKEQIYQTLLDWANNRYQPDERFNDRVLYQNPEEGNIAVGGEEYIVFKSSALSLDRTRIYYQLQIFCEDNKSKITMTRIRYWYNENRDGGEKYVAEEWITDDVALNKTKTKLYPVSSKFRKGTIDLKDQIFNEILTVLGNVSTPQSPKQQEVPAVQETASVQTITTQAMPQPTDINSLIEQAARMTITAGNDEQFEVSKECWGGFGELFGKKVVFCLIDTQKTMGNLLMTQSENYKISFYQQNNNEPTVIFDCKKLMQQTISGEEAQKMSPSSTSEKSYNMYVGEIIK